MSLRRIIDAADANALLSLRASLGDASFYKLVADQEAVHAALARQFRLLADTPTPPNADAAVADIEAELRRSHVVLRTLLEDASGTTSAAGCPLVHAVHYRLRDSLHLLLGRLTARDLSVCLTERDAFNATVLHVASEAKAAGIAQRFAQGGSVPAMGRHIDVALPLNSALGVASLNHAIGTADLEALLFAGLRRAGLARDEWIDARNGRGLAALHVACRAGRANAVRLLLERGASAMLRESESGATCGHLAAARGHEEALQAWSEWAGPAVVSERDAFGRSVRDMADPTADDWTTDSRECVEEPVVGRAADGWRPMDADVLLGLEAEGTLFDSPPMGSVATVDAAQLSRRRFVEHYESKSRPVLLRKALLRGGGWAALVSPDRAWSRARLARAAGHLPTMVSPSPYDRRSRAPRQTLNDFLVAMLQQRAHRPRSAVNRSAWRGDVAPVGYIFDSGRLLKESGLDADVGDAPDALNVRSHEIVLRQLSVSPPLAGAHMHFHGSVLNSLIVGTRRWALVPPSLAEFSLDVPAIDRFGELRYGGRAQGATANGSKSRHQPPWLDCIQRAGDVLWLPPQWGHATLSLSDAVSVALEHV